MNDENTKSTENNSINGLKNSLIEFSKYIPILYPVFVFLGYINYDFYYKKFNIDIFNYLSINEFLFSFISLIYPIIFLFVAHLSFNAYNDLVINNKKDKRELEINKEEEKKGISEKHYENYELKKSIYKNQLSLGKNSWSEKKYPQAIGNYILMILLFVLYWVVFVLPTLILWYAFTIIFIPLYSITSFKIKKPGYLDEPQLLLTVILFCYIAIIVVLGIKHLKNEITRNSLRFYLIAIFIVGVISSLMQYQNIRAYDFTNQRATKELCFVYENQNITTSDSKKLLGITAEYIFLRDNENRTNYIYKLSEVRNLEISEIKIE